MYYKLIILPLLLAANLSYAINLNDLDSTRNFESESVLQDLGTSAPVIATESDSESGGELISIVSSRKGFIGLTGKTYDGKMSSIDGGIALSMACIEEYPLAHACTYDEIKKNLDSFSPFQGTNIIGKNAWLSNSGCKNFTDNIRSHKKNLGMHRTATGQKRVFQDVLHLAIVLKVPTLNYSLEKHLKVYKDQLNKNTKQTAKRLVYRAPVSQTIRQAVSRGRLTSNISNLPDWGKHGLAETKYFGKQASYCLAKNINTDEYKLIFDSNGDGGILCPNNSSKYIKNGRCIYAVHRYTKDSFKGGPVKLSLKIPHLNKSDCEKVREVAPKLEKELAKALFDHQIETFLAENTKTYKTYKDRSSGGIAKVTCDTQLPVSCCR